MSARRANVRLSQQALADYDGILLWTQIEYGDEMALVYQVDLDNALERLGRFPGLGTLLPGFDAQIRKLVCRSHILFFRLIEEGVAIIRILHQRQDVTVADLSLE